MTNHERLFCDESGPLRNLECDLLYVIPIELDYSACRVRLENVWGTPIVGLPVLPLREIVRRRVDAAGFALDELFPAGQLDRLIAASGGHTRTLFLLLSGLVVRSGDLSRRST